MVWPDSEGDDVAGAGGAAAGHVFGGGNDDGEVD